MKSNQSLIHNGSHFYNDEPSFEWWYFHFYSKSGITFNLLIHSTDIFGGKSNKYMSATLINLKNEVHYFYQKLPESTFNESNKSLNINTKYLTLIEYEYYLKLSFFFDDFIGEGDIQKTRDPYIQNNGTLITNSKNMSNYWWVPIPLGKYNLNVSLKKELLSLSGSIYHDHNWGTALLENSINSWIWFHLTFEDGFLLIYCVLDKTFKENKRGLFNYQGKNYSLNKYELTNFKWENKLVNNLSLTFIAEHLPVTVEIKFKKIIRKRNNYKYNEFSPLYHRSIAKSKIYIGKRKLSGQGLIEHLIIKEND